MDESRVEGTTVNISGKIVNPTVSRLVINNLAATVDPATQTFSLNNVTLTNYENNLVYRMYDVGGTLLGKGFITVYSNAVSAGSSTTNTTTITPTTSGSSTTTTYKEDSRFQITAPSASYYETSESMVRIEGQVAANTAAAVLVNGFKLTSFTPNGTTWHYFANEQYGTMEAGTNTYTIRYLDASGDEIYRQLFVIKKN